MHEFILVNLHYLFKYIVSIIMREIPVKNKYTSRVDQKKERKKRTPILPPNKCKESETSHSIAILCHV